MNRIHKIFFIIVVGFLLGTAYAVDSIPSLDELDKDLSSENIEDQDDKPARYPVKNPKTDSYSDINKKYPMDLKDPSSVTTGVEYDPTTGLYYFRNQVGNEDIVTPFTLTEDEYLDYSLKQSMRDYWNDRVSQETEAEKKKKFSLTDIQFGLGKAEKVFGPGGVQLKLQGSVELLFGFKINKVQNPALSERLRNPSPVFDFDEKIQLNVNGKVGDKINFGLNYNTEASFDYDQSKIKLAYEGKEDDIIKNIEAGNVSLPLNSSLIRGSSALFGVKTELQFGKLKVAAVVSQQESETKTVSMKNGAQTTDFEVEATDYDENRHYFLSHFFRDNFEKNMSRLPNLNSGIEINRVEVWVTNKRADFTSSRNVVAFLDLAESGHRRNKSWGIKSSGYPNNKTNTLYEEVLALDGCRDIQRVNSVLEVNYPSLVGGEDFEKIESARRLESTEYTVNTQMGFISLRTQLNADEVLAVAYEYTAGGKVYQVGEFSTDGIDAPKTLVLKLLKGTSFSPELENWDLMMKNVYSLRASQVQQEDFKLDVVYQSDSSGVYVNYLPEGKKKNQSLLKVLGLDRIDKRDRLRPDGFFDFVDGYTILPQMGRIIFPVLEPFGSDLEEAIGDSVLAKKYVFKELYSQTKTDAEEFSEKNKFKLRGQYRASSNSEIRLNAMNVPRGSVTVTAGGVLLTENVDYTVDYSMGTVTILNQSLIESGTSIDVSLESQSLFSMQRKTLVGTHLEYAFNKDFSIGATVMHLSEKPLTNKVNAGEEPISNTIWGANISYKKESQKLTSWLSKIPFLDLKAPSSFMINGEFAQLIPGHSDVVGKEGYAYVDDFEAAKTFVNIMYPYSWYLASVPRRFSESNKSNNIDYGKNRAHMSWFTIDPLFTRNTSTTPKHIQNDKEQQSNHFIREISEQEIFPNREPIAGQANTLAALNISYYPTERGAYNLDAEDIYPNGSLKYPQQRWGGIMRKMDVTDFESANIECIEFWMLDPFIYNKKSEGGDLYFNIGELSEDILRDGKKSFENGLSAVGDLSICDTTVWGVIPRTQSVVNAFDNNESSRKYQDVGLDGLANDKEFEFPTYSNYVKKYQEKISVEYLDSLQNDAHSPLNDPAGDDYHYYRGTDYDDRQLGVIERYKYYNGMEGNSPISTSSEEFTTSATNMPNMEDVNQDNNMNEYEKYFEYKISLRPGDMNIGSNHIVDKLETSVSLENGNTENVTWYHFKIPVRDYDEAVGSVSLKSIRFIRMYMTNFSEETHLRFGTLELVRGDWRKYTKRSLYPTNVPPITSNTSLDVSVVNIEENAAKKPVNYILPPGVEREQDPSQTQVRQENEQSMSLKVTDLSPQDARAVYKNIHFDMRQYKRLQMFVHAEKFIDDITDLKNGELTCFIRLGSDFNENYYEYEVPLTLTPEGMYSIADGSSDANIVWPNENKLDIPLSIFTDIKKARNREKRQAGSSVSYLTEYSIYDSNNDKNRVTIVGNPTLGDIQNIMIGVRNQSSKIKSGEIWVNELRLTGFDEDGGYAAMANATLNLSDFASLNLAGRIETTGFGGIEDNVQDRRMDDYSEFNVSTNVELGKFFPEKANVKIPVYYAYGRESTKPKYDPYNNDLLLKETIEMANLQSEKDSIEQCASKLYTTHSFNITNLKVDIRSKKPKPYDPANFSLSYAFTTTNEQNPDVERSVTRDHKGTFSYNYTVTPKPWEPFKNIKALKKPAFKIISDFNLFYYPSSINFNMGMTRQYTEEQGRSLNNPEINYNDPNNALLSNSKDFLWSRQFDIKYDLSRELKFSFSCASNSQIDETKYAPVNKKLFPTEYENWKDTVMKSMAKGGTPLSYQQTFTANLNLPINKIPIFSWITTNAMYTGNYTWNRGALTAEDEAAGITNPSLGNDITSLGTFQWSGRLSFLQLYNKVPYLKRANQRFSSTPNTKKDSKKKEDKPMHKEEKVMLKKGVTKRIMHRFGTSKVRLTAFGADSTSVKLKYKIVDNNTIEIKPKEDAKLTIVLDGTPIDENPKGFAAVLQGATRFLMMIRNVSFNYNQSNGMSISGFLPAGGLFGQNGGAPGALFSLGYQKSDFLQDAYNKGWLVKNDSTIAAAGQTYTSDLTIKMNLEPIPGLKIDLGVARNYATDRQIQYQYEGMPTTFTGSFSMTTIAIGTLFKSQGDASNNYYNETFEKFKANRAQMKQILEQRFAGKVYPNSGFMTASENAKFVGQKFDPNNGTFSNNAAEVLIPSFLSAYTGSSLSSTDIIPSILRLLPNWRITYDGLIRIPFIKRYFKSVNLTHSYVCKYNVGAFSSYANFVDAGGGYGFVPSVETNAPIPSSQYDISSVSITENFNPLIRLDATLKNSLTLSTEYRCGRTLALNIASTQLVESSSKEFVFGIGYRLADFDLILHLKNDKESKVNNDLNLRLDLSKKKNSALIRKLEEDATQATSGEDAWGLQFSAEYVFSSKLNIKLYYDWESNTPLISSSYPTSNHNFGISLKLLLTR